MRARPSPRERLNSPLTDCLRGRAEAERARWCCPQPPLRTPPRLLAWLLACLRAATDPAQRVVFVVMSALGAGAFERECHVLRSMVVHQRPVVRVVTGVMGVKQA